MFLAENVEKSTDIDRKDDFPTNAELNIRLRKIIGSFQKLWRQKEIEKTKVVTFFIQYSLMLLYFCTMITMGTVFCH